MWLKSKTFILLSALVVYYFGNFSEDGVVGGGWIFRCEHCVALFLALMQHLSQLFRRVFAGANQPTFVAPVEPSEGAQRAVNVSRWRILIEIENVVADVSHFGLYRTQIFFSFGHIFNQQHHLFIHTFHCRAQIRFLSRGVSKVIDRSVTRLLNWRYGYGWFYKWKDRS